MKVVTALRHLVFAFLRRVEGESFLAGASFRALGCVWAASCHGYVVVCVLALVAKGLVESVLWFVCAKLGVHVPAYFLRASHRVVELLLWHLVQGFELLLQDFEFSFTITTALFDKRLHTCRFVRDRNHCITIQIPSQKTCLM